MNTLKINAITLFLLLLPWQINAQEAWEKIMLKGKITYNSFTTTKDFDADGSLIKKSESEFSGSADQVITFFPGRYQLMAKNTQKLNEFYEANTYHVFFGEVHDNATSKPILFPVYFSIKSKSWEKCNNEGELILMGTSEANGTSHTIAAKTYLSMIPTRSQREVDEDKIIAKGLDAFAKQVMEVKKMQDIKEEKKINEDDYLVPANLYNPGTSGLYLFTNWWSTNFQNLPVINKDRNYDCITKKWEESSGRKTDIHIQDDNRKLLQDFDEEGNTGRFRYVKISMKQMEEFVKNPSSLATFIGGSYKFYKENNGQESETRTIITLTVSKKN